MRAARIHCSRRERWAVLQPEAFQDLRGLQQAQHVADAEAAVPQIEQVKKGPQAAAFPVGAAVGDAERDAPRRGALGAEHRRNERGIGLDIRGHDDDVAGPQLRIFLEHRQQLVPQDLDLSHGAVAGVDPDGGVGRQPRIRLRVSEVQDVGLEAAQQGVSVGLDELLGLIGRKIP